MFEVITLASGSEGNSTLVRNETASFLIDAGLSAKQLTARLLAVGLCPEQLSAILLTHEHGDHTSALKVMLTRHRAGILQFAHRPSPSGPRFGSWGLEVFSNRLAVLDWKLCDPAILSPP